VSRVPWNLVGLGVILAAMGFAVWDMRRRGRHAAEPRYRDLPGWWADDDMDF
jgi:hypothetical protein